MTKMLASGFALASLAGCVLFAVWRFQGAISDEAYKSGFLWSSVGWFVFQTASFWLASKRKASSG
jgi:hypothetical protein